MKKKNNLHFVTFFTEGNKSDRGLDLSDQKETLFALLNDDFSTTTAYSPTQLIRMNAEWLTIFEDKREYMNHALEKTGDNIRWNENWAALNFLLWKPALINYVLKHDDRIQYGDTVFYHDVDIKKYPAYLYDIKKWQTYIKNKIANRSVLLFNDNNTRLVKDVKMELLLKSFEDIHSAKYLHHIWAGALAIKKNDYGLQFADRWMELTEILENRSQLTKYSTEKGFYWHSQEQACLSVLYHNEKQSKQIGCEFLNGDRCMPPKKFSNVTWIMTEYKPKKIFQKCVSKVKNIMHSYFCVNS
jgi:hypothetical protein